MATYHSNRQAARKYGGVRKSVTLGTSFHSPMPMPFRPDGLPDWDTPGLGSFVSFALENGPLKGRVVILRRLQNGMYVIAPDDASSKNDENRNLDKEKLRKEEGINPDEEIQNALESTMKAYRSAAWTRKEGKNPHGGLNAKGRASAKREGHNLRPPVKQAKSLSEMKRQYSFLSRMSGMPGPERDENGKPTRLLLSLQAWGASSKAAAKRKAAALKRRIDAAETQKSLARTFGEEEIMKLMFKANGDADVTDKPDEKKVGLSGAEKARAMQAVGAKMRARQSDAPVNPEKEGPGQLSFSRISADAPRRGGPATPGSFASATIPGARPSATAKTTADTAARVKELRASMPLDDYMDHAAAQHHLATTPIPKVGAKNGETTSLGEVIQKMAKYGPVTAGSGKAVTDHYGNAAVSALLPDYGGNKEGLEEHTYSLITPEKGRGIGVSHIEHFIRQGHDPETAHKLAAHAMRDLDIQDIISREARGMQPRAARPKIFPAEGSETFRERNRRMAEGESGARGLDQGRSLINITGQDSEGQRAVVGQTLGGARGGVGPRRGGSGSSSPSSSSSSRSGSRTGPGGSGPMASPIREGMRIVTGEDGTRRVEADPDRTPRFVPTSEEIQRKVKEIPGVEPKGRKDPSELPDPKFAQESSGESLFNNLPSITAGIIKRAVMSGDTEKARAAAARAHGGETDIADKIISYLQSQSSSKSMIRSAKRDLVKAFYRLRKAEADDEMKHVAGFLGLDLPSGASSPSPEPERRARPEGSGGRRPRRVEGELKTGTGSGMSFFDMADATRGGRQRVSGREDSAGGPGKVRGSSIWSGTAAGGSDRRSAQQVREDAARRDANAASRAGTPKKAPIRRKGSPSFDALARQFSSAVEKLKSGGMSHSEAVAHIQNMSPKSLRMSYGEYQNFQKAFRIWNRRYR